MKVAIRFIALVAICGAQGNAEKYLSQSWYTSRFSTPKPDANYPNAGDRFALSLLSQEQAEAIINKCVKSLVRQTAL